jgi:D-alanyl-lipoteichoic acid acyltransferase DltB (MBOAT superfamily)
VAGPIERSDKLIPQLKKNSEFNYDRIVSGLKIMARGFFVKIVIADNLAVGVNYVFADIESHNGVTIFFAVVFFSLQIYSDFSGYSSIAIGSAKVMGVDLMENFKRPYFAISIKAFWTRWHISLSTWFRDYVYIPLGGSRVSKIRAYSNVLFVFLVSGLWHGADWKFVVWGGIHGCYQIFETIFSSTLSRFWNLIKLDGTKFQKSFNWVTTMSVVLFAWIFFRANSIEDATMIISKIYTDFKNILHVGYLIQSLQATSLTKSTFIALFISIIIMLVDDMRTEVEGVGILSAFKTKVALRWILYVFYLLVILLFGFFGKSEFIYFEF